ncbi:MAG: NrtA/SsuA/CpmA family ABC transporter substrate-binding protein [Deltaproteobacteria bacterium]|nr:NrtA/SsuA/CpmA family ABC transporter substrate-binding protein [Deltaproteobacteria bacterium]
MKRFPVVIPAFLAVISCGLGLSALFSGCNSGKMETLTVAMVPTELNALFYVAEGQNFFAANGLQVILKEDYDSGASAAAGMLKGETDLALAAEFPIVRQIFNKNDIASFGTVAKYENTYLIGRTDSGIKTIQDLKGKKAGVTLKTISEFYLGRTLDLHGMNIQQVNLVDIKAPDSEKAITGKEVDAVATWEPWVAQITHRLGKEVITMPLQGGQYAYWNLVSTSGWIKKHPHLIKRLIKSLVEAESYLAGHPGEAKAIVRKRMKFDEVYLEIIWKRYQFSLSLDQSLITAMEDEARWMIKNGLTAEKQVPNFLDSIHENSLKAQKPEAVNMIR